MELILDGMVGPTHHFGGLSWGNLASLTHKDSISFPKQAALEGLKKMKQTKDLGALQGVLPPHKRPDTKTLRLFGWEGSDSQVISQAAQEAPALLRHCYSSSNMWAANSATVTPSSDAADHLLHLTIANLGSHFHRSLEPPMHEKGLKQLFANTPNTLIHPPVPYGGQLGDEGANHLRFGEEGQKGVHLFVYGTEALSDKPNCGARQSKEAQEAICRRHKLPKEQTVFVKQHPKAIEAGVFHNDVISFGLKNLFFYHEKAFENSAEKVGALCDKVKEVCGTPLLAIEVPEVDLPLKEAISTYLFNSELISLNSKEMALIAPEECQNHVKTQTLLNHWIQNASIPIHRVLYSPLRQSMQNGGGPACLSLRIPLTMEQAQSVDARFLLTDPLYQTLIDFVDAHYRETLYLDDLTDPNFLAETVLVFNKLASLFKLRMD